jgi:hypothetical protein
MGGALYVVNSKEFEGEPGRAEYEWATQEEIIPIEKEVFDSALDIMEKEGIKIYFLGNLEAYERFHELPSWKERKKYLESLK